MKRVLAWILAIVIHMVGYMCLLGESEVNTAEHPYLWFFVYVFGMVTILWPAIWYWIDKMEELFKVGKWKP
jgi:hypothetical protein